MSSASDTWKSIAIRLGLVILVGAAVALILVLILSIVSRNAVCKNSSTCPQYQTCGGGGFCVSLPGYKCKVNNQCSIYGPVCSKGLYCTNFSNKPRGTAGNPPREGSGPKCDPGLTLNTTANLCQQAMIGAKCTIDAECNQGLCDKTCQFASRCTTDTVLNPLQCMPPYECDQSRLQCTTPGTTPGADGTPCNSNSDCGTGSSCISGPPSSGFSGVCRSGYLTWLTMFGIGAGTGSSCMTPLVGPPLNYCRYDTKDFMRCTTVGQCQYPYASCDLNLQVCKPESADRIDPAEFLYTPVGLNPTAKGGFYNATYATTPAEADNATGGKLIDQYKGFLTSGQFEDQPEFQGRQLVTLTSVTSFTVVSFAVATDPPSPPQIPYYAAIFEDPNPMLAMCSIIEHAGDPGNSILTFSFYNQGYTVPNFSPEMNIWVGRIVFPTAGARIWNPSAIADTNPALDPIAFVPNPIVSPWIIISAPSTNPISQTAMTHCLFYANNRYCMGFLLANIGLGGYNFMSSGVFSPAVLSATGTVVSLTSDVLLITSWDALTTYIVGNADDVVYVTILLYGLHSSGKRELYTAQISLNQHNGDMFIVGQPSGVAHDQFLIFSAGISDDVRTVSTQVRLSRTQSLLAEPLLMLTFFAEEVTGLGVTMFSINSTGETFQLDTRTTCTSHEVIPGLTVLKYVTPLTGGYNYGGFVVWCSTIEASSAFMLIQIRGLCNGTGLAWGTIYSMVYWRRLTGEVEDYYLYPVGGASLPFFLATDVPLSFSGVPTLPPIST